MTLDQAIALSLLTHLPRKGLTARLSGETAALCALAEPGLDQARAVRKAATSAGMGVLAWNDPAYPAGLLAISDCPPVLWYRGLPGCFTAPAVAIVGSRAASPAAIHMANQLAADLAALGIVIVSGLARGVDSAAHRGALKRGRTMAVLGSGLDRIYPAEHGDLASQIQQAGVVMTEHAPGTPALPHHFPLRNRLISGLSRAVIVIEASERSGSLITAACALEQGRDVMAVPGHVPSGRNRGGHALIRDGARIVECAQDVLEELGWTPADAQVARAPVNPDNASRSGDPLLRVLEPGYAYQLDDLVTATGLAAARLLPRLSELELHGVVRRVEGGRFVRLA